MRGSARVASTLLVCSYKSYFSSVLVCFFFCQCVIHRFRSYSSVSVCGTCTKGILGNAVVVVVVDKLYRVFYQYLIVSLL